jgi:hypothetical protein
MTREPFPLTTGLPSIARDGNGSAGPSPTRPARGDTLSPASVVRRWSARMVHERLYQGRPVTRREMGSRGPGEPFPPREATTQP